MVSLIPSLLNSYTFILKLLEICTENRHMNFTITCTIFYLHMPNRPLLCPAPTPAIRLKQGNTRLSFEAHLPLTQRVPVSTEAWHRIIWGFGYITQKYVNFPLSCLGMQNWEVFWVTISDWGRKWCGNWFFQSLNISNAKTLLSGYFWGSNSWRLMNGKTPSYLSSIGPNFTSTTHPRRCLNLRLNI